MRTLFILLCATALACGPVFGAKPTPTPTPAEETAAQDATHWLSASGKRHNDKCRYFKKTKGVPCGAQDGTACKVCGG